MKPLYVVPRGGKLTSGWAVINTRTGQPYYFKTRDEARAAAKRMSQEAQAQATPSQPIQLEGNLQ